MDIKVTNFFKSESKKETEASFTGKVIQLLKQRMKNKSSPSGLLDEIR